MRSRLLALPIVVAALVSQALPSAAGSVPSPALDAWSDGWKPRPATYPNVAVTRDVPIKMSDGVKLYADILRPADNNGDPVEGRFPVLLTQTPYNKNGSINFRTDYLIQRGYVQVIVDVRGTGNSEGNWDSFGKREQRDGAELVKWVASPDRPWSDGNVGLHGTSYGAINQIFTAAQHPAGLRAIFPVVPMADAYRDIAESGGQINTSFIPLWLGLVTGLSLLPPYYVQSDPAEAMQNLATHAANVAQFQAQAVVDASTGGSHAFDGPFYRTRSPIEVVDDVGVPTFIVGGWYDLFQRGEPMLFERLQADGVPVKLLMGPWYHITAGEGLENYGLPSVNELELRWFDHYVRGVPDPGLSGTPPVTYFRLGADRYETTSSWPPPDVDYGQVYLSGPSYPGEPGALKNHVPAKQDADALLWQPGSGACTRSTVQWTAGVGEGSWCENDNRANDATGLAYDLPVASDLDFAGPVAARLFVGTNGRDGMLTVRLEDVAPDGSASQITAGWQVLSLRALDPKKSLIENGLVVRPYHPFTQKSQLPVSAGKVYEVWVEIFPAAADVGKGHSLRMSIQPSDSPHLSPPLPQAAQEAGGVLQVYHDRKHPSALILPVQP